MTRLLSSSTEQCFTLDGAFTSPAKLFPGNRAQHTLHVHNRMYKMLCSVLCTRNRLDTLERSRFATAAPQHEHQQNKQHLHTGQLPSDFQESPRHDKQKHPQKQKESLKPVYSNYAYASRKRIFV